MEFERFSLGVRFVMQGSVQETAAKAWSLLFGFLPPHEVSGLRLYGIHQPANDFEMEPAYICVFSRASLKRCKLVYARLAANPLIRSYLTLYHPFLQNNRLCAMEGFAELGTVDEGGYVVGGSVSYGKMCFVGERAKVDPLVVEPPVFLIAPDAYCGLLSSSEVIRELMRIAYAYFPYAQIVPYPLANGSDGVIDALIHALGGRYVSCSVPLDGEEAYRTHYGILPSRTVVIGETEATRAKDVLLYAMEDGYTSFIVGVNRQEDRALFSQENDPRLLKTQIQVFDSTSGVAPYLDFAAFDKYVQQASLVITGDGETVHARDMVPEVERRCERYNTQVAVLDGIDPKPQTEEAAKMRLRNSANDLFRLLQMGNRLQYRLRK